MRLQNLAIVSLILTAALSAQTLNCGFAAGNGQSGNMFDVVAINDLTIKTFDVHVSGTGPYDFEVYTLPTGMPYLPEVFNPAAWTLVGSASAVPGNGTGVPTFLPICVNTFVPAGATQAFYVTISNGTGINYTNGTVTGALWVADANLEFYEGSGMSYPFGSNFNPRVFNGNINYELGNTTATGCVFLTPPKMVGVVEMAPGAGTLNNTGGVFVGGDFIRWNLDDFTGSYPGAPAIVVANYGYGGPPAVGVTAQIPGFDQLSAASTPSGTAIIVGPNVIGGADISVFVPPSLLSPGDSLRLQGLVLDLTTSNPVPVIPTQNTIIFTQGLSCLFEEGFETTPPGLASFPVGWSSGGGIQEWTADVGGTTSSATGPTTGAFGSSVYMYCETSGPAAGDTYIMNTDTYSLAGATTVGFSLSRIGATMGTLEVRMDDGTGTYPTLLATYTGPEPNGIEWVQETLTIPAGAPASTSFQFHYARGTSFTGDVAIDSFCIN